MATLDLVDLGASGLDDESNAIWVQCKGTSAGSDYGQAPFMCSLGISARPAPADDSGNAQGIVTSVPGIDGVVVGGFDPRSTEVFGQIAPGETALHATGKNFDSRVLCKEQLLALVVGDDMVTVMDREKKQIAWAVGGYAGNVSAENGWLLLDQNGSAGIQIKDGCVYVFGQVVLGGRTPLMPVAMQAAGQAGPTSAPAAGVFIGV
jgi:hypothetical protein